MLPERPVAVARATPSLDDLRSISMMTADELALYYNCALSRPKGSGGFVEIGPWLGGGTLAIARGAACARPESWTLEVRDRFQWTAAYARKYGAVVPVDGCFMDVFATNVAEHLDRIRIVRGDYEDDPGPLPGPVDALFVDAPLGWAATRRVLGHFAPGLTEGASLVLRSLFDPRGKTGVLALLSTPEVELAEVSATGTAARIVLHDPAGLRLPGNVDHLAPAALRDLFAAIAAVVPPMQRERVAACLAVELARRGDPAGARQVADTELGLQEMVAYFNRAIA